MVAAVEPRDHRAARDALARLDRQRLDARGDLGGDARFVERDRLRGGFALGMDRGFGERACGDFARAARRLGRRREVLLASAPVCTNASKSASARRREKGMQRPGE
ncbi:MAG: hypothetical protein RML56_01605 [Burkholderiales bacterium]|nr:hypothetical protein [Burkholderiales bacterium]